MKRRKKIKIITFTSALLSALIVWGIVGTVTSYTYKKEIELQNERALTELCEYMDSIEVALTKSLYAGSSSMLGTLTSDLQRNTAGAKESLSTLESGETKLYNTYKFLSQVGEFTASLNRKVISGQKITEEERRTLKTLLEFSSKLSLQFQHMSSLLSADYFTFDEISDNLLSLDTGSENTVSYIDSISDTEMTFDNFPSLIYDGPFSDNILSKESKLLKESDEISIEKAKDIAAKLLSVDRKLLVEDNDSEGKIPSYTLRTEIYSITLTKNGGFPLQIMSSKSVGEEKITSADAIEKASLFLNNAGFLNMVSTYTSSNDGVCTINFAYKDGSFICYPDLIKVNVSLFDGEILGMEASDYIMNHVKRNIPDFKISPQDAMQDTVQSLRVKKISAAVIPDKNGGENYTYELFCEDTDGQHILIYKDIETGEEKDILILLYSDGGVLTK